MRWIFWGAAVAILYTYVGYAAYLWMRQHLHSRPWKRLPFTPRVSIVMVVRNEEKFLERKLRNLLDLDYPPEQLEIVVISDGSKDATSSILSRFVERTGIRAIVNEAARGKAAGLNDALETAQGELIVFTDARQIFERDAVRLLAENFADPAVGCASGELMLGDPDAGESVQGMGLYWRIEKKVREMESASGSVIGATGAIYAVRRSLLSPIPTETILDDVYIPMNVVRQGSRVIFDPRARAWDLPHLGTSREFSRKVRTLSGNYQLLQLAPWLLSSGNPVRFEFISHKLLRLIAPFALAALLVASIWLRESVYRVALGSQLAFYALSGLAVVNLKRGPVARIADAAFTFVVLNTAALVAFANFVTGKKAAWSR